MFLNSSATGIVLVTLPRTAVETAIARCTSRCAMAGGHRLNTSIVLAAVHGLSGLFRAVSAIKPSLSRLPPPSPSLISNLASVVHCSNSAYRSPSRDKPAPWPPAARDILPRVQSGQRHVQLTTSASGELVSQAKRNHADTLFLYKDNQRIVSCRHRCPHQNQRPLQC